MKILIAEDDPIMLDSLKACVEAEGLTPLTAANGAEAFELFLRESPALVCLDIMMPCLDGFTVCRRIREHNTTVPILFLSAKNEERDIVHGLDLGADDFIRKPFTRPEVMARIRAALRRIPEKPSPPFTMCDLKVEPKALRAIRNHTSIPLTQREVAILHTLHLHAGRPVSRNTLLDHCWGRDYFPDSRTLDQHILTLRKKIEHTPAQPIIIQTVRSIGYIYSPQ